MLERMRLRNDVIERLKAADTAVEDQVFRSRINPIPQKDCPAISVYTLSEIGSSDGAAHLPSFNVNLTLKLDVYVAASECWDDDLDDLCEQIEVALLQDPEFVKDFSEINSYSTNIQLSDGGELPVAIAAITIGLTYRNKFDPIIPDELKVTAIKTESDGPVRIEINHEQ
ncbi:MAG: hypothetical protein V7727_19960 [Sneathiella sp.]